MSFANIWRLGCIRDIKFGTNVSNEMLQNARVTAFMFLTYQGKTSRGVKFWKDGFGIN